MQQEDAHEFARLLIANIQGADPTGVIHSIFGGELRSQIQCGKCKANFDTYEDFLDLSLEITHADSVIKALRQFTQSEMLDGDNKYACPNMQLQDARHKALFSASHSACAAASP